MTLTFDAVLARARADYDRGYREALATSKAMADTERPAYWLGVRQAIAAYVKHTPPKARPLRDITCIKCAVPICPDCLARIGRIRRG